MPTERGASIARRPPTTLAQGSTLAERDLRAGTPAQAAALCEAALPTPGFG